MRSSRIRTGLLQYPPLDVSTGGVPTILQEETLPWEVPPLGGDRPPWEETDPPPSPEEIPMSRQLHLPPQ